MRTACRRRRRRRSRAAGSRSVGRVGGRPAGGRSVGMTRCVRRRLTWAAVSLRARPLARSRRGLHEACSRGAN